MENQEFINGGQGRRHPAEHGSAARKGAFPVRKKTQIAVTAEAEVFRDYLRLIGPEGKPAEVPESGAALIQGRIGEHLGIKDLQ